MAEVVDVRTALGLKLEAIHPRVFYNRASDKAEFPYLVYDIINITYEGEPGSLYMVDIEGWDKTETGDTTALETLMAAVKTGLDKQILTSGSTTAVFFIDSQMPVEDSSDERIIRRRQGYQARVYERS